ncbi:hypothetical protein [Paraburkholderia sediminicola]|uniref:hypothetical protein n=1 Tax=Paraburkholderia sediminicola TaxID=458836 RepID=UPI0038BE0F9F
MSIMANALCQNGQMSILVDKRSRWFSPTGRGRAAARVDKTAQSGQRKKFVMQSRSIGEAHAIELARRLFIWTIKF